MTPDKVVAAVQEVHTVQSAVTTALAHENSADEEMPSGTWNQPATPASLDTLTQLPIRKRRVQEVCT